ncbi:hypothetical protein M441DRAFT_71907 [Trichoderma asperellum CBS 433.97]|uniref:Uncharacterized protein n=1 Tax=Trichoderma asperellum (strain ATCC 204424 / CBS 433.97 / NBRC 101777) TaxID=1042311 RepID=A0A2T3Z0Z9_TRIA4|nr:hypothetical protein M441DRAFT_71907 [Trichoderma asperellum CBS 433.97]PTB38475.1 hypothetical protein M441DRAFT_71907 [Trichoderma asperellum CBS 433.97]
MAGGDRGRPTSPNGLILEAWSQGLMVGSLFVMAAVVISNMRKRILLHKLILAELILGIPHGTFIFFANPVYGWYLSATAIALCVSWSLHNVIAWMKNRPFLSRKGSLFYIGTVILVQPYWILEIYANFTFYNDINTIFRKTRPFEPLFRDPWWVFTVSHLFYIIKRQYTLTILELVRVSPRFGIMLVSMCLSIVFTILDECSVLGALPLNLPDGVEPFWKLSFICKCLCDVIILDDFKIALDRIRNKWLQRTQTSPVHLEDVEAARSGSGPASESSNL